MFGKNKKDNKADIKQQSAVSSAPSVKQKAKKKKSGMALIFRESVLETVMADFRDNEAFIHKENGVDKYVGILLDTHDIGGLDKKSKKSEAKGQLIECINSGRIKTLITNELMDEECIVFIPDVFTLNAMDEFSLLTDAKYEICYVEPNGDIELLGTKVTYKEVTDILVNDGHIDDILGSEEDEEQDDDFDDLLNDNESDVSDAENDNVDSFDDYDENDATSFDDEDDDDVPMIDDDGNIIQDDDFDNDISTDSNTYNQPVSENVNASNDGTGIDLDKQPQEPESENEIPQEWVQEAIVRKFYSDDLGLEITVDPFDVQFLQGNTFVPFDENRPSTWLNDALNEMARQANDEMNRMHQENIFLMRERYFRLMSIYCDGIRKDLDVNDPNTLYGQLKMQLDDDHEANLQSIDSQIAAQKEELETAWRQRLQEVGMDAAREAQHRYRERYQPAHEQKIYDIADAVKANIDAEYKFGIRDLNDRRRTEASSLLDLGISETLDEISEMYMSALESERVRYHELAENIREFQQDYLKEDITRIEVLQEELRQNEKADAVLAEQTARIQALTDEYAAKRDDLQSDIEHLRKENKARLEQMKKDCDKDIERVNADKESLRQQYNTLLDKYNNLDEKKDEEYKARMGELKDELEAWSEKYDHIVDVHKTNNRIATFFVIAAVIAAITIGFIAGEFANSKHNVNQQIQQIQQQQAQQQYNNMNQNQIQTQSQADDDVTNK